MWSQIKAHRPIVRGAWLSTLRMGLDSPMSRQTTEDKPPRRGVRLLSETPTYSAVCFNYTVFLQYLGVRDQQSLQNSAGRFNSYPICQIHSVTERLCARLQSARRGFNPHPNVQFVASGCVKRCEDHIHSTLRDGRSWGFYPLLSGSDSLAGFQILGPKHCWTMY